MARKFSCFFYWFYADCHIYHNHTKPFHWPYFLLNFFHYETHMISKTDDGRRIQNDCIENELSLIQHQQDKKNVNFIEPKMVTLSLPWCSREWDYSEGESTRRNRVPPLTRVSSHLPFLYGIYSKPVPPFTPRITHKGFVFGVGFVVKNVKSSFHLLEFYISFEWLKKNVFIRTIFEGIWVSILQRSNQFLILPAVQIKPQNSSKNYVFHTRTWK